MKKITDKEGVELLIGDVIDIHQTVNGQNVFVILNIEPLDIRYGHDLGRKYEYDKEELLSQYYFTFEPAFEIIDNIGMEVVNEFMNID